MRNKEELHQLDINEESNCFFTLKDHKENFQNNPTVWLINVAKNEVGRISKVILDKMNSSLIKQLKVNQWKNTQNVIEWFMKIEEKSKQKFIVFDIKRLPINTGNTNQSNKLWRKTCKDKDKIIIEHSRKSLL